MRLTPRGGRIRRCTIRLLPRAHARSGGIACRRGALGPLLPAVRRLLAMP